MSKLKLIIWREYITRIRKRSFILGTFLAPVGLLVYILVIVGLTKYEGGGGLNVAVLDEAGVVGQLADEKGIRYNIVKEKSLDELKEAVTSEQYDGVLRIPQIGNVREKEFTIYYYSDNKIGPEKRAMIEEAVTDKIRDYKITALNLDKSSLEDLETDVSIDPESITAEGEDESKYTADIGLAIGGIMAFIMFFMVLFYGQMVMRSVMEEKTNRIVEVMMSSVRPFDLMLGKILGAGAVGLTQVVAWVVLSMIVTMIVPMISGLDPSQVQPAMGPGQMPQLDPETMENEQFRLLAELSKQNWLLIIFSFIIFFLGGYFIYSSMFAAIGSAMSDDLGEGQSLTLPVTLPIILAFYITAFAGMRNPDSGLMVFASIFPLFSPIVMPFRMAFDPPWWQVAISLILVVLSAFFFVWLAGRIYRVGILLYGKKVTLKEIGRWMFWR
jgi:ABC-2 type transport system permease protein